MADVKEVKVRHEKYLLNAQIKFREMETTISEVKKKYKGWNLEDIRPWRRKKWVNLSIQQ